MERLSNMTNMPQRVERGTQVATHLSIFYSHDFTKDIIGLKSLIFNLKEINQHLPLNKIQPMVAETARCKRSQMLTEENWKSLVGDISRRIFSSLILPGKSGVMDATIGLSNVGLDDIEVTMNNKLLFQEQNLTSRVIFFAKLCWEMSGGIYGFILIGPTWNFVSAEASGIVLGKFGVEPTPEENRRNQEVWFYGRNKEKQKEFVRKAYWGNFLNATHIEKLGGVDFVKSKAPCFKVEPLANGAIYLQLTESPLDFSQPDFVTRLKILDDFLQPTILPGRPQVVFT